MLGDKEIPGSCRLGGQCAVCRRALRDHGAIQTFDKFKATLERNKAALVERHACTRVKFTVYEKDGKAALKASPIK